MAASTFRPPRKKCEVQIVLPRLNQLQERLFQCSWHSRLSNRLGCSRSFEAFILTEQHPSTHRRRVVRVHTQSIALYFCFHLRMYAPPQSIPMHRSYLCFPRLYSAESVNIE